MDYAGDVLPSECYDRLATSDSGVLVDVRTRVEWNFVGVPFTQDGTITVITQEWQQFPQMSVDPDFVATLKNQLLAAGFDENSELHFLCRSGVRSLAAARAMTAAGFGKCFNISGGFEGDLDENSQRGTRNGWKAAGLPWKQS